MTRGVLETIGQAAADLALTLDSSLGCAIRRTQGLLREPLPPGLTEELRRIESDALACRAELKDAIARGRRHAPRLAVLQPEHLLYRALEFAEPRAREAGVRISLALADDLPRIVGDPVALEHAILLSILGAVQAVKERGADLTVLADVVWEYDLPVLRVSVIDDRPGPPISSPPDLRVPGRGLGLGVARDVVVDHGGTFTPTGRGAGGFQVTLTLPGTTAGRTILDAVDLPEEWERG